MRILTRYILRAHIAPFLFAVSALTLIMLLDQIGKRFGRLVGKGLEATVIAEVFALSIPFILAMTLPMAVLIAVLYTFNRLAADNEITAMKASGIHLPRLMAPVLLASVVLALGMVWFNDTILPESNHELQVLLSSISQKKPTLVLRERTINEVLDGELYIQAARIDRNTSELSDVVIYDERDRERRRTIRAERGSMAFNEARTDLFLTLFDGHSQERRIAEPESFQRIYFADMIMRVPDVSNRLNRQDLDGYRGDREMSIADMRAEVRASSLEAEVALAEGRRYAELLTRRLLGEDVSSEVEDASLAGRASGPGGAVTSADSTSGRAPADSASGDTAADEAADPETAPGLDTAGEMPRLEDSAAAAAARDSAVEAAFRRATLNVMGTRTLSSASSRMQSYDRRRTSGLERRNRFAVEIQKKYSIPAACVVFVLIGAPLAVRFREAGVAMVVGLSLAFFCAYYVSLVGGEELADRLILSPFWAMWLPNVLFGGIGVYLVRRGVKVG